jgi:threonine dehydratase
MSTICLKEIKKAAVTIKDRVIRTPLVYSSTLSRRFGGRIFLKLENLQKTGSFKIRGATHKILTRKKEIGPKGVVAASAGNHGQGVALAAREAGIHSTIVMPEWVSISKQEATRGYGGSVLIEGDSIQKSIEIAMDLAGKDGSFIHPFDDIEIITGQGTIALEILEDQSDIDMIVVPIGGGGLVSGIASAAKAIRPAMKIIGVQSAACPSAYQSLKKGKIVQVSAKPSIADGMAVKQVGRLNFDIIRGLVDDVALVNEKHISLAILTLLERKKILAEGAGAAPLAALMNGSIKVSENEKVVLIISGGNVDSPLLGRIISQGLARNGRIMRFLVRLNDTPGALAGLLQLIAGLKANVLDIHHDRFIKDGPLYVSHVKLELETRGAKHVKEIERELKAVGYNMELE